METIVDIPKYNLNEEEEKKEILRHYRALLRTLKPKLKPGDKELFARLLKWQLMHTEPCAVKVESHTFCIHWQ
jgi:hypothetical protein